MQEGFAAAAGAGVALPMMAPVGHLQPAPGNAYRNASFPAPGMQLPSIARAAAASPTARATLDWQACDRKPNEHVTGGLDVRLDVALAKTPLGRRYLEQPPVPGRRGRRSLLIIMDGRKTLLELLPVIRSMGLSLHDVETMVDQGMLAPASPPRPPAIDERAGAPGIDSSSQDAPAMDASADDRSVGGDTVPMPQPDLAPDGQGWLAPARLFAADLLTHMLDRPGSLMHDRLQAIDSAPGMMAWIEECTLYVAAAAGPERADRFQLQVTDFVPLALRGTAPAPRSLTLADLVPGRKPWQRSPWVGDPRWADPPTRPPRGRQPPQPTSRPGELMEED